MTKKRAHRRGSSMIQYTLSRASGERTERFAAPRCDRRTGRPWSSRRHRHNRSRHDDDRRTRHGCEGRGSWHVGGSNLRLYDTAPRGDTGVPGATGAQGDAGVPGAAATLDVGTTTTGAAGSQRARSARHTKWHVIGAYLQLHDSNRHAGRSGRA
jgi:hypothetical protein